MGSLGLALEEGGFFLATGRSSYLFSRHLTFHSIFTVIQKYQSLLLAPVYSLILPSHDEHLAGNRSEVPRPRCQPAAAYSTQDIPCLPSHYNHLSSPRAPSFYDLPPSKQAWASVVLGSWVERTY